LFKFDLHLLTVVALLSNFFDEEYHAKKLRNELAMKMLKSVGIQKEQQREIRIEEFSDLREFTEELLTHGLIEKFTYTTRQYDSEDLEHRLILTKKYFRFRYWVAFHKNLPENVLCDLLEKRELQFKNNDE
jgi:hypothetical protein